MLCSGNVGSRWWAVGYNDVKMEADLADRAWYVALTSRTNLFNEEPQGRKAISFKDLDLLLGHWIDKKLCPPG